jgi:hypothetical protein
MEPSLNQIEDYNGNESKEKKQTVYIVVALLIALGVGYTMVKSSLDANMPNEFIPYSYDNSVLQEKKN